MLFRARVVESREGVVEAKVEASASEPSTSKSALSTHTSWPGLRPVRCAGSEEIGLYENRYLFIAYPFADSRQINIFIYFYIYYTTFPGILGGPHCFLAFKCHIVFHMVIALHSAIS